MFIFEKPTNKQKRGGTSGWGQRMFCQMATSSFAWISVTVKRREQVIKAREILKCSWVDTFGSLLLKFDDL